MSDREIKFRNLLKSYGVTKCYIGNGFSFDVQYPDGTIFIDSNDNTLCNELYKLFTEDEDGLLGEEQSLFIGFNDFTKIMPNYPLEG